MLATIYCGVLAFKAGGIFSRVGSGDGMRIKKFGGLRKPP